LSAVDFGGLGKKVLDKKVCLCYITHNFNEEVFKEKNMFHPKWTTIETQTLENNMEKSIETLEKLLPGRSRGSILSKMKKLKDLDKYVTIPSSGRAWTEEEISVFPEDKNVDSKVLTQVAQSLPLRNKNSIWKKMKSLGYVWIKSELDLTPTEENPYPMHGKPWTQEEINLFPENKTVNEEILRETQAKLPLRKPSSIWPKLKTLGYVWEASERPVEVVTQSPELNKDAEYLVSFLNELGFRKANFENRGTTVLGISAFDTFDTKPNCREEISTKYSLPEDFNSRQLIYAVNSIGTVFPWEMNLIPEILEAQKNPTTQNIKAAALALNNKLEKYLNG
jgi:hypothetical protein